MAANVDEKETGKTNRVAGFTLLDEAVWRLSFAKETAMNGGVDSDRGGGLTEKGGYGLSIILSEVIRDINKATELL